MQPHMAVVASLFVTLSSASADAGNCIPRPERFNLASDTVYWSVLLPAGGNCIQGLRYASMQIEHVFIVSAPKNGSVVLQGPSFRYQANPQFRGSDSFSLSVNGTAGQVPGSSIINIDVTVR